MKHPLKPLWTLLLVLALVLTLLPSGASAAAASGGDPAGWSNIIQLVTGYDFVLGLRSDGSLLYRGGRDSAAAAAAGWTGITQLIPLG